MRAITIEAYGGSERLQVMELPIPEVGPNDVLIRMRASTGPISISAKGALPRWGRRRARRGERPCGYRAYRAGAATRRPPAVHGLCR